MVIIEAKKYDLENDFNQLMAQLIALNIWEDKESSDFLYGVVSVGEIWQFALLDKNKQYIINMIYILIMSPKI